MRIAMLNITAGGMSGGYRKYLLNIVPRLGRHPEVTELLVAVPDRLDFPNWEQECSSITRLRLTAAMGRSLRGAHRRASDVIRSFGPDVIFIPTARFWTLDGVPAVNMVQNMAPFMDQNGMQSFSYRIRNRLRFKDACKALKNANRIIAVSDFVKEYLIDNLAIIETKIGTVYHGIQLVHDGGPVKKPVCVPDQWSHNFIFTAGLIYPYRGLEDVILALHHLNSSSDSPTLAIAGKIGQGMKRYYHSLKKLGERKRLTSKVRWLGVLEEAEMSWCYRNCSTFVVTSQVEACPNIVLEAMAHGCMSVSTSNPPMREFFGNVALYYPSGRSDLLAQQIHRVSQWPNDKREEIKKRALTRVSDFSWEGCVEKTVLELEKAIGDSKNQ